MLYTKIINNNKDFVSIYKNGNQIISKAVVIYFRKNNLPYNRFGITAGKKIGNAVKRNRAKRIIRQAYMENEINFPVGIDIVIVARSLATQVKSSFITNFLNKKAIKEIKSFFKVKLI